MLADGSENFLKGKVSNNAGSPGIEKCGDGDNIGLLTIGVPDGSDGTGKLEATGGKWTAGIGGGFWGVTSNIIISGGEVKATGGADASAIGGGACVSGSNITISGGTVITTGAGGIGSERREGGTGFYTELGGKKGTAFIETEYITDQSEKENWTGIIHLLKNKEWFIKGNPICKEDITFESDETIDFAEDTALTQSGNLTNENEINIPSSSKIMCSKNFTNDGKMIIDGILNVDGQVNWNSVEVTGSGEITPESAKIPATFTVPDLNLNKMYDGKPVNIDEEQIKASCSYSAHGKEESGTGEITIVHQKNGETLSSAPSEVGKYSLLVSTESGRFYQGGTKTFDYEIKALPKDDNSTNDNSTDGKPSNKIDFSYLEQNKNSQKNETTGNKNVEISNGETKEVGYEDGTAIISVKKSGNNLEVEIKDKNGNELNVDGKINLIVSHQNCKPETVVLQVNSDGTREVVRKAIVKNGKIYLPLNSSGKFEIFDNLKTFYDVPESHWAYNAVTFVSAYELFNGTAPNIFEPETPMSRAMMVKVLHNLEDNPYQSFEKIFDDVNFDDWFAEAVTWGATHNGTIVGYGDGNFGPNDSITREQLATILYRYFGKNEIVDANLNFVDANEISDYAMKALRWAVANRIVQGKGNNILDPKGLATRAEVAQMFQNFMLNLFYN